MFSWLKVPDSPEVNWNDFTQVYVDYYKNITYSLYDREEKPVVYTNVPSIPIGGKGFGVDFSPITFLSSFYVNTCKGTVLFFIKNNFKKPLPQS